MTICERMFAMMEEKGKTAYGLCKAIGVDSGQASSWKRRKTDPPAKYLSKISEYLGTTIEYLVTGKGLDTSENDRYFSEQEIRLIDRYRHLDDDGKALVKALIIQEERRALEQQRMQDEKKSTL